MKNHNARAASVAMALAWPISANLAELFGSDFNRCHVGTTDMPKRWNDGYVRMTLPAFYALRFRQHMCQQAPDLLHDLWGEGISAVNAGYYELVCTDTQPAASVGCAWYVAVGQSDVKVGQGDVSSNVMLLDTDGDDYGARYSRALIQNWLCSGARQRELESAVVADH
ncbi:DUF4902 domain-containing protein [Burkholderia sp. Nafp2/4-1b]|uniref:DUF4902 domain-containing protein n=1 Tax=Burkholderia sp. Nafp2/4-1b TaxID=2116686 RepID=UPI001F08B39E|nr:DUF4902 domain-containing protein [Burkholderia sp. Nafp2/4-1b]